MSSKRCWARQPNDSRCDQPAMPATYFCARHMRDSSPPHALLIFRAPEAEMPPALVQTIRRYAPEVTFPAAAGRPPLPTHAGAARPAPQAVAPGPVAPETPPAAPREGEPESVDWLLAYLREAITGLMAGEATPLQKANAVARLGSLYLKTAGAAELKRENKALTRRIAELEQGAAAEAPMAAATAPIRLPAERHETIAAASAKHRGPHRPPGSHAAMERGPSPHAGPPDDAGDEPWDADDPSLAAAAPPAPS